MFKKKEPKFKTTTEEDSWLTKAWNTQRGRPALKLAIYAIFLLFVFLIILIQGPNKEENTEIKYDQNKYIVEKDISSVNDNNYHFEYNLLINGNTIRFYGDKNKNVELGYKEDASGIVKYLKDNDLVYKILIDDKVLMDNLYENINVNYLSYNYINSLIKDITPIKEKDNLIYIISPDIKITIYKTNITINDKTDVYELKYSNIGSIKEITNINER